MFKTTGFFHTHTFTHQTQMLAYILENIQMTSRGFLGECVGRPPHSEALALVEGPTAGM